MFYRFKNPCLKTLFISFSSISCLFFLSSCTCSNTPSIKIKKSETFYNNLSGTPENLHPIKSTDGYSSAIQRHILESLLDINLDTYQWEPSLAHRWTISPDGLSFTFYLHKNLKWSDGKPLTAHDVKFTFEASKDPKYGGIHLIPYFENLKSAKLLDDYTITFKAKNLYFGNFQTVAGMQIIPQHIYKDPKLKMSKTVIGSGPYTIEHNIKGKVLILRKNPLWATAREPSNKNKWNFKTIVFRFIKTEANSILRLQRGDIDYARITPESYTQKTHQKPWGVTIEKVKVQTKKPSGFSFIGFNLQKPLFKDQRVRQALSHLMNRKVMNEKFYFNLRDLATGPWSFQSDFADPLVKPIEFNPQKATQILKEAGWQDKNKDGLLEKTINNQNLKLEFTLIYSNSDSEKILTLYQEDLKKAGIKLNLKILDWTSFLRLIDDKNFDAVNLGWGGGSIDLDPKQIWHSKSSSKGGSNFVSYSNPKVDALIDRGRRQLNRSERIKTFQEVYRLIAKDVPYLFMFTSSSVLYGVNKRIYRPKPAFNYSVGEVYWSLNPY
ncbi:MAG: ABC transporter substrate-binding protein [Bdellovibrionales bacterium]